MSIYHALTCAIERYRIGRAIDRGDMAGAAGRVTAYVDATLERLGFKLAVFALAGLFSASGALADCFRRIRQEGTSGPLQERLALKDFEALIGVEDYRRLERAFATAAPPR